MFIGREKEIAQLENAYSADDFSLFLVYGAKGYGKTTLLEEFCRNKSAIYFTASNESSRANLSRFSEKVLNFFVDKNHEPFTFWDNAMSYIAKKFKTHRIILVIDVFDIIAQNDSAFLNLFARIIDSELRYSRMMIVIACENAGFLKNTPLLSKLSGAMKLGKFLTEENIALLKANEMKQSGTIQRAKFVKVPADSVILREGTSNSEMYKIISGRAVCSINYGTDNEYVLGGLKEGKTFGEYSLLSDKPGVYTVTAFTDMLLLRIGREDFMTFLEISAANSVNIMQNMASMMNMMKVNIDMLNEELHHQD